MFANKTSKEAETDMEDSNISLDDKEKKELKEGGLPALIALCEKKQNAWKNIPVNVAITGSCGTGKSSYINAIRGLSADDTGAAVVDEIEATCEPTPYPHPDNPNIKFWDLPGVGTTNFPRARYLQDVVFDRYDFFLILSTESFSEDDTWLAKQIHSRQKKFFFVRTKIDNSINDNKRAHPKTHDEAVLLHRIKTNCKKQLSAIVVNPDVFLISNHEKTKFDFRLLANELVKDCPARQRDAMVLTLTIMSDEIIHEKAKALKKQVWVVALLSAAGGAVPIPGVSAAVDAYVIFAAYTKYRKQFGLDDESLASAAKEANISLDDMKKSNAAMLGAMSIEAVGKALGVMAVSEVAERTLSIALPIIGSVIASGISYTVTTLFLRAKIDDMAIASLKISRYITAQIASSKLGQL